MNKFRATKTSWMGCRLLRNRLFICLFLFSPPSRFRGIEEKRQDLDRSPTQVLERGRGGGEGKLINFHRRSSPISVGSLLRRGGNGDVPSLFTASSRLEQPLSRPTGCCNCLISSSFSLAHSHTTISPNGKLSIN